MGKIVNNKLNMFLDFTRRTRLAFLEMAELDSEYVLEQWCLCKHSCRKLIDTNLMSLAFFISLFNAQHVSYVSTSILRSVRLIC